MFWGKGRLNIAHIECRPFVAGAESDQGIFAQVQEGGLGHLALRVDESIASAPSQSTYRDEGQGVFGQGSCHKDDVGDLAGEVSKPSCLKSASPRIDCFGVQCPFRNGPFSREKSILLFRFLGNREM